MKELLLSKRTLLGAAITGAVAFLFAVLINQALGRFVLPLPEGAEVDVSELGAPIADAEGGDEDGVRPRPNSRRPRRVDYVGDILARNIFDSSALGQAPPTGGDGGSALTDLNLKLIATIVADPTTFSSALISGDGRNDKAFGYGIDDRITGTDAVVVSIEQKRVQLKRSNGKLEYLEMGGEDKPKEPTGGGRKPPTDDEGGISQEGGKTIVERSVVDDALNNVDKLAGQIRAVPHKGPDGEIDGFRLSAIRRGTLFDKLGIKNGDIVHAVNGMPLTSTEGALSAYQTLSSSAEFSFDVTRRNKRQTYDYEIR